MRELATVFKALSDETRLDIMALLLIGGELCVCDVEGALAITQSKASRHLRYLLNAGLVENRRVGAWMHYHIPRGLDPTRREVIRATRKLVPDDRRHELEKQLQSWLADKQAATACCGG